MFLIAAILIAVLAYAVYALVGIIRNIIKKDTDHLKIKVQKAAKGIVLCCAVICFIIILIPTMYSYPKYDESSYSTENTNAKLVYTVAVQYFQKASDNNVEFTDCTFSGNLNRTCEKNERKYDGTSEDFDNALCYQMGRPGGAGYYWAEISKDGVVSAQWSRGNQKFGQHPDPVSCLNADKVKRNVPLIKITAVEEEFDVFKAITIVLIVLIILLFVCIITSKIQYKKLKAKSNGMIEENIQDKDKENNHEKSNSDIVVIIAMSITVFLFLFILPLSTSPVKKPVIYLYPEEETQVSVKLDFDGELLTTYPKYNDGWKVTAMPDGTLYDKDGNEYSYLFWDGKASIDYDMSKGFVVKGEDTAEFLHAKLSYMGLTPKEYNDFIVYWLPEMEKNSYNLITFQGSAYTDCAELDISPKPDSVLRVFMVYKPLDHYIDIAPQELETFERSGFTVVEWGGSEDK